jgi:hypothetical protein
MRKRPQVSPSTADQVRGRFSSRGTGVNSFVIHLYIRTAVDSSTATITVAMLTSRLAIANHRATQSGDYAAANQDWGSPETVETLVRLILFGLGSPLPYNTAGAQADVRTTGVLSVRPLRVADWRRTTVMAMSSAIAGTVAIVRGLPPICAEIRQDLEQTSPASGQARRRRSAGLESRVGNPCRPPWTPAPR